ncbi:hypothetical protein G5C51_38075 [Streptomyces sp. A7024]|uniref:Peptide chain release factor 1 n=1 Tax=Streptomyces coryli TaxID=1128680 RepID=A0A6G4UCE1_9ACTN|nr:Vms1/Ankzf1 family peptidyl-tRNA hydrolase [Streptomyces coryli]NGN69682.1 hypothetical protein [Streptomyces coryli]
MKLAFLDPLLHTPGPWASVYFGTARNTEDAATQQELQARAACERLAAQGADDATCQALYAELSTPAPGLPGRALFASHGAVRLDIPLTTPPAQPESCWTALPHTGPLLDYAGADPACLVAYVDRTGAGMELYDAQGRHPAGQVEGHDWPVHRTATAEWSERHFQNAVEDTWEANAARAAEAVAATAEDCGAEFVVLAGDPRERRAVRDKLPQQLRVAAVESDHGGRAAGSGAGQRLLDAELETLRAEQAHAHAEEALQRFRAGRVPTEGRIDAAEGVPALIDAAREHRIEALLVRSGGTDLHRDVWVGPEPDQLALRRTDAQYLGEPRPAAARADDALIRSAAATGAEVIPLPDPDGRGAAPVGGLGALLRWPYEGGLPGGGRPREA